MIIAKLRVSLLNCNIKYNSSLELETTKERGTVLAGGQVVRGLGTHFESKEAKERFDRLTSRANSIREEFNRKFARFLFEGTFVVKAGEGKAFAAQFDGDKPDIEVSCFEYDVTGTPDEKEMAEWSERISAQLKRIPLGRGEEADADGLAALEAMAGCPIIATDTADAIRRMVAEVRIGKMNRPQLRRGIRQLGVSLNTEQLSVSETLNIRRGSVPV